MVRDDLSVSVRIAGSITLAPALLEVARRVEEIPKSLSIIDVDSYSSATSGTGETVIVLKTSEGTWAGSPQLDHSKSNAAPVDNRVHFPVTKRSKREPQACENTK